MKILIPEGTKEYNSYGNNFEYPHHSIEVANEFKINTYIFSLQVRFATIVAVYFISNLFYGYTPNIKQFKGFHMRFTNSNVQKS